MVGYGPRTVFVDGLGADLLMRSPLIHDLTDFIELTSFVGKNGKECKCPQNFNRLIRKLLMNKGMRNENAYKNFN